MYTFEGRVRYSECDEHGSLSLQALINYLQDTSTFHSESIGRGVAYMQQRELGWLIAAWQIEIARLPRFNDQIAVDAWVYGMTRTQASRNFVMRDASGAPLVKADSLWFVFDFAAGRPIRIPQDQNVYLTGEKRLDMPAMQRRLSVSGPSVDAPALTVSEQHLDSNRHVNNAQYIGMALNALAASPDAVSLAVPVKSTSICVQYKRQALLGDVIVPHVHAAEGACIVDLTNPSQESYAIVRIEPHAS